MRHIADLRAYRLELNPIKRDETAGKDRANFASGCARSPKAQSRRCYILPIMPVSVGFIFDSSSVKVAMLSVSATQHAATIS